MKHEKIIGIILWVIVIGIIYHALSHLHPAEPIVRTKVIHDTVTIVKPIPKDSIIIRKDTVRLAVVYNISDTITKTDSVYVEIPIERKIYEDSVYFAVVSGYRVSLDSIKVYQRNTIVERYIKSKPKRFGIGVVGGYGLSKDGLTPFFGVGVSYNLFSF